MSNIIQFNEFAEASDAVNCAKELLQDQHAAIIQENQKLLSEVMALEEKNASKDLLNMNLAGQVKELQAENTILLDALVQDDDFFESKPKAGETLLVLGAAGNTGLAAVEIGKAMGARVIAVASTQEKLDIAKQHGADDCILLSDTLGDDVKALVKHKGVDVVFDPIGGDAFDACVRRMAWNGRYLVVGFAAGRIPELPVNLALVKGFSLIGVFWGTFTQKQPQDYAANQVELFNWYQQGLIKPYIDKAYPFDEVRTALADVLNRKVKGKVILTP